MRCGEIANRLDMPFYTQREVLPVLNTDRCSLRRELAVIALFALHFRLDQIGSSDNALGDFAHLLVLIAGLKVDSLERLFFTHAMAIH